jgi:thiol-disulfide isomerase/thioredoxin
VGSRAPSFAAVDDEGREISTAVYEGKVLVVYFWSTWCAPCVVSGPAMESLQEHYRDEPRVAVLGVHYDNRGDPVDYMKRHGYTYDIVPDGRVIVAGYGIKKIPSIVVVGTDGKVLHNQVGFADGDEDELIRVIDAHL